MVNLKELILWTFSLAFLGCSQSSSSTCDPKQGSEFYTCPDGSHVPWCTCQNGTWQCIQDPQKSCSNITPCANDRDCPPDSFCHPCATSSCPNCDDCQAGCLLHGCPSESVLACLVARPLCGEKAVAVIKDGCWVCLDRKTCEPVVPRDTSCDQGELQCTQPQPDCQEWEIPAVQDGCWRCVNRETCRPWGEPGCQNDMQCPPQKMCDPCAGHSCPTCDDCVADCRPHGCPTEPQANCRMPRPQCPQGQVAVVWGDCWVCVELESCQPARDKSCDDGSQLLCEMVPPACNEKETLAIQNGCWKCVNSVSCKPWGEPGCKKDADCPPEKYCHPCGTSSCPKCDDCLAACLPHSCTTEKEATCNCARPDCPEGQTSVIKNGCWICVTLENCSPSGEGC